MSKEQQHETPAPLPAPEVSYQVDRVLIQVVVGVHKRGVKFNELVLPAQPVAILADPDCEGGFGATLEKVLPHFVEAARQSAEQRG